MQNGYVVKIYSPLLFLFLSLTALFLILQFTLPGASGISFPVLHIGNLLLFIVGWVSIRMSAAALHHKSVQVFLRLVYGSFLLKFFFLAAGAIFYIFLYRKNINKPALFGCFGLYFMYTFIEVRSVLKQSKKPNA